MNKKLKEMSLNDLYLKRQSLLRQLYQTFPSKRKAGRPSDKISLVGDQVIFDRDITNGPMAICISRSKDVIERNGKREYDWVYKLWVWGSFEDYEKVETAKLLGKPLKDHE